MLGLLLILHALSFIAFIFGFYHAAKAALLHYNQGNILPAYPILIGGFLATVSSTMFIPIQDIGLILWAIGSLLCCIGVYWYNKITEKPTAVPLILHLFIPVSIFMILNFFQSVL